MATPGAVPSFEFNATYVHSLRQGDPTVEEHFVSHFSPILLRKFRRKLCSTELANDLRQETFLRVFSALRSEGGVRRPERFEVFVLGVGKNVLRETYRQRKPLVQMPPDFDRASNAPSPYACALAAETGNRVRRVLSRLDPDACAILQAALLEEQDRDEICLRFGITRNYLRLLIYRAKEEFAARMQKEMRSKTRGPMLRARRTGRRVFTALHPRPVVSRSPSPGTTSSPAPVFLPPMHTTGPGSQCWL
jgi:RNA polymerase sigma factor (sigma-70 family)